MSEVFKSCPTQDQGAWVKKKKLGETEQTDMLSTINQSVWIRLLDLCATPSARSDISLSKNKQRLQKTRKVMYFGNFQAVCHLDHEFFMHTTTYHLLS